METQHRLLITLMFGIFLSISLVSAVSISYAPSQVNLNENFNLQISGSGFYALEMTIPQAFQIVSDSSGGTRTGDLYKTVTTGSLTIVLRGIQAGTYTILGQYTDGSGIKDLNSKTIQINQPYNPPSPSCPTCPSATEWSNCENNQQIKYVYSCSSSTNYQCIQSTETQSCQIQQTQTPPPTCEVKWICKDSDNLAYQSSDCSLSSIQKCSVGCENGECKIPPNIVEPNSTTPTINPAGNKETPQSVFARIINFIKRIIDALIFWD